ncbi:MAG: ribonuclease inhibitor, partial [Tunicatimonas sp.]
DSVLQQLRPVAEQVTWLDLGNRPTTDEALATLSQFEHLTRLHLENTAVSNAGMAHLKDLPYLEYLNLYGTKVSDEGVAQLSELKNLRKLYLWQTNVTVQAAARLEEAVPGLEVNLGLDAVPSDSVKTADGAEEKQETAQRNIEDKLVAQSEPVNLN